MHTTPATPPAWQVSQWFNTPQPITLAGLRGRVVVLHTFQMLCPACVSHGIPQALRVHQLFAGEQVAVLGLHTVFEHHEAMGPPALRAFIHEYRIPFPVGIDQAGTNDAVPLTMQAYGLRGTPSMLVFDTLGRLRLNHFGALDDLQLGAVMGQLLTEAQSADPATEAQEQADMR
jgi:AhpC/TSA family